MRWSRVVSLAITGAMIAASYAAHDVSSTVPPREPARVLSVNKISDRVRDLVMDSPSVGTVTVRLLLPAGFQTVPHRRWPVLYLLHGANDPDTYQCWTRSTDVIALTAGLPLLIVMPEGGPQGYYSDWFNHGRGGPPAWETFHLVELLAVLHRDWRASDQRAVAGLSMGGLGAMLYAAHRPHLFRAAASFSGILDTANWQPPPQVWGDRSRHADIWRRHNPLDRTADLRGVSLFVSYGNGNPGPLDTGGTPLEEARQTEQQLAPGNTAFVHRLRDLGIPATVDAYGPGTHSWPYWQRELHRVLPGIMEALQP